MTVATRYQFVSVHSKRIAESIFPTIPEIVPGVSCQITPQLSRLNFQRLATEGVSPLDFLQSNLTQSALLDNQSDWT